MPTQTLIDEKLEDLARTDRRAAHDEARRRVAEQPADEAAALQLREVIRRFPPQPRYPEPDPLAGANSSVRRASVLLDRRETEEAEILLRSRLAAAPRDVIAMRLMARIAAATNFPENANKILVRSLEYDSTVPENWFAFGKLVHQLATASDRIELLDEAIHALDRAIELAPGHEQARIMKAAILMQLHRIDDARLTFQSLLGERPDASLAWSNYAYLLKTFGEFGRAVAAYRTAAALAPENSQSWGGLANLKVARFFQLDIDEMEVQVAVAEPKPRVEIHFALARAYDEIREYARAAEHLRLGSHLRSEQQPHDRESVSAGVTRATATYTPAFFAARVGSGETSPAPIFILGLPRAGSTLIEQILSSHSMIEGTEELFLVHQLEKELSEGSDSRMLEDLVEGIPLPQLGELGRRYLDLSKRYRTTSRPRFTDKNPANWRHVGFIHAILPNAKIIDARRDPMDCCFSNYTQHFGWGANFAYDLGHLGSQYRDYLRLMRHFDLAVPGLVHRVINDELVENFEDEVRRLLEYLDLPFEEQCLRFYETERAVNTPSSEQVRQPINRKGIGRWRNYEPWLGELKESLAPVLDDWRR